MTTPSPSVLYWNEMSVDALGGVDLGFGGGGSAFPQLQVGAVNTFRDSLLFGANSQAPWTSPGTLQVVGAANNFSFLWVHKGSALTTNQYYSLFTMAGVDAADSGTLFYTQITGMPTFYLQFGNGTCAIIGVDDTFIYNQLHACSMTYNGGGYANASSWSLRVNGVQVPITITMAGGGNGTNNVLGDGGSGGGATNAGEFTEFVFCLEKLSQYHLDGWERYCQYFYGCVYPQNYTPLSLAPGFWLDSDHELDTSGTVTKALDQSGNARDITYQSAGTDRRPTVTSGVNGHLKLVYGPNSGGNFAGTFTPELGFTAAFALDGASIGGGLNPVLLNVKGTGGKELRIQVVPSAGGFKQLTASIIGESTLNIGIDGYYTNFYQTLHVLIVEYNGAGADVPANWRFTVSNLHVATATDTTPLSSAFGNNSMGTVNPGSPGFDPAGDWYHAIYINSTISPQQRLFLGQFLGKRLGLWP